MRELKKIFRNLFVSLCVLLLTVQILLLNDNIKSKLSTIYDIESQYVYSEQELPKGSVTVEISTPDSNVYILQNGEIISDFGNKKATVEVYDNSVIEFDGRCADGNFTVKLNEVSDNLDGYYNKSLQIDNNIVILGRFFVK